MFAFILRCNLEVHGLPENATAYDLEAIFKPYGQLLAVKVLYNQNGTVSGVGSVNFADDQAPHPTIVGVQCCPAETAMAELGADMKLGLSIAVAENHHQYGKDYAQSSRILIE